MASRHHSSSCDTHNSTQLKREKESVRIRVIHILHLTVPSDSYSPHHTKVNRLHNFTLDPVTQLIPLYNTNSHNPDDTL